MTSELAARHRRAGLTALLVATAVAYLWGLSRNGYANEYYAAAVQAGSSGWKAWFFGPWSMLVPQALMGVAASWQWHVAGGPKRCTA